MSSPSIPFPEPMSTSSEDDARLLFCPFCRECYEGERTCPVHELELVDFQDLPKQGHERDLPGWDEDVDPWDIRFGRGFLALGAVGLLAGFFLPFATAMFEDTATTWTGYTLATGRAGNLWTVPFVAAMFVYFLLRRRTPIKMLGTRLVAIVLSIMPAGSLAYTVHRVQQGVSGQHGAVTISWDTGAYVIAASCVLLLIGSVRFGVLKMQDLAPHGAGPEDGEDRGISRE